MNIFISIFTGENLPHIVQEAICSKEKLYLDTLAKIKKKIEQLLIQAQSSSTPTSRKAMEPQPQREEAKHDRKTSVESAHK